MGCWHRCYMHLLWWFTAAKRSTGNMQTQTQQFLHMTCQLGERQWDMVRVIQRSIGSFPSCHVTCFKKDSQFVRKFSDLSYFGPRGWPVRLWKNILTTDLCCMPADSLHSCLSDNFKEYIVIMGSKTRTALRPVRMMKVLKPVEQRCSLPLKSKRIIWEY